MDLLLSGKKAIGLKLTSACNFRCKICLRENSGKYKHFSLEELKIILPKLKQKGYSILRLTGGEICLHPKFEKVIAQIAKYDFLIRIVTNGFYLKKYKFITKQYPGLLTEIAVSIDGATSTVHDHIRHKGSFNRALKTIKFFSQNKIKTYLNFCVNKLNSNQIEGIVKLATSLDATGVKIMGMIENKKNKRYSLNSLEKISVISSVESLKKKYSLPIVMTYSLRGDYQGKCCQGLDLKNLVINESGFFQFCCDANEKYSSVGSLEKESFDKLFKKALRLTDFLKGERIKILTGRNRKRKNIKYTCDFCNRLLEKYSKIPK